MVKAIKITSKRQATLPVALCEELGVHPGEELVLERRILDGEAAWVLHSKTRQKTSWFGSLKTYAEDKSHDMESIRAAIGKAAGASKS